MKNRGKYVLFLLTVWFATYSQAVGFGLIQEMLNNGSLSQKDYEFKRDKSSQIVGVEAESKQLAAVKSFTGKAHGMVFQYQGTTSKKIKRLFKIDRKICNYATDKYFDSIGDLKLEKSALNSLDEKDLYRLRFKRCMQSESWRIAR